MGPLTKWGQLEWNAPVAPLPLGSPVQQTHLGHTHFIVSFETAAMNFQMLIELFHIHDNAINAMFLYQAEMELASSSTTN